MLLDLHSAKLRQGELDLEMLEAQDCARERLMGVLDEPRLSIRDLTV